MAGMSGLLQRYPTIHVSLCVFGIVTSLLIYSILQEKIMTQPFGMDKVLFKYSLLLVLVNRLVTLSVALACLLAKGLSCKPVAPLYSYAAVSASNVIATSCQYEALKYVTFPVQTLGKSAKMLPVMLWGSLILRKSYSRRDYLIAATITAGCTLFLTSGEVKSRQAGSVAESTGWRVLLMAVYLSFDGFTSTFQARLFRGYSMTVYNQVFYTTLCSALYSLLGLYMSGQLRESVQYLVQHPQCSLYILSLSAAATAGQFCIVHTIKAFGPLLLATVMTTRQFASILLSCLLFAHPLSKLQWSGTGLVFGAVLYKIQGGGAKPAKPNLSKVGFSEAHKHVGGIAAEQSERK